MHYELGNYGLQILIGFSIAFGALAQVLAFNGRTRWLGVFAAAGWFVGGLFFSEVLFGLSTVDEIQPIIDGLAFDEALLGGLLGGVGVTLVEWLLTRAQPVARLSRSV